MYEIRNKKDLELAYLFARDPKCNEINPEAVKELKRDIRKYTHKPISDVVYVGGDWDNYTILFPIPADNLEEAHEWFMRNEYRECMPSMYDCTGQTFTAWYKIFKRNGKYMAYHHVRMDV